MDGICFLCTCNSWLFGYKKHRRCDHETWMFHFCWRACRILLYSVVSISERDQNWTPNSLYLIRHSVQDAFDGRDAGLWSTQGSWSFSSRRCSERSASSERCSAWAERPAPRRTAHLQVMSSRCRCGSAQPAVNMREPRSWRCRPWMTLQRV